MEHALALYRELRHTTRLDHHTCWQLAEQAASHSIDPNRKPVMNLLNKREHKTNESVWTSRINLSVEDEIQINRWANAQRRELLIRHQRMLDQRVKPAPSNNLLVRIVRQITSWL